MTDEDGEVGLPQKGLNMIIKDVIPEMRIANESRELLNACCVEFVKHVSREAQRISAHDQRKTIYHEHVQKGMLVFYSMNSHSGYFLTGLRLWIAHILFKPFPFRPSCGGRK
uniref:Protein Dr1 n=1 Tax=Ascaris lumbricoides TaxID=6252 RepID=A0A0M3I482_ASCLU